MDPPISLSFASTAGNASTPGFMSHTSPGSPSPALLAKIVPGAEPPDSGFGQRPAVVGLELLEQVGGLLRLGEPGEVRASLHARSTFGKQSARGAVHDEPQQLRGSWVCVYSRTGRAPAKPAGQSGALAADHARTVVAPPPPRPGRRTPGPRKCRRRSGRGPWAPGPTPSSRCPCAAGAGCTRWCRAPRVISNCTNLKNRMGAVLYRDSP